LETFLYDDGMEIDDQILKVQMLCTFSFFMLD